MRSSSHTTDRSVADAHEVSLVVPCGLAAPESAVHNLRRFRALYFALGWFFFAVGVIGALLPVLPTTPFMLLAAWAFGKSSRRFEAWLLNHRMFGPSIVRFRRHRVVPKRAKVFAWGTMATTFLATLFLTAAPWWGLLSQALLMSIGAIVVGRYPSDEPDATRGSSRPAGQ